MKSFTKIILAIAVIALFTKCSNDKYLIAKEQVGEITKQTSVEDLKSIFKNDSIKEIANSDNEKKYEIFSKKGEKELEVTFAKKDSVLKINSVQIFSNKYKTAKNISINATFNDIRQNYTIDKAESTFSSIVLFVDELDATISVEKSAFSGISKHVDLEEIPDNAKVKYFMVWF